LAQVLQSVSGDSNIYCAMRVYIVLWACLAYSVQGRRADKINATADWVVHRPVPFQLSAAHRHGVKVSSARRLPLVSMDSKQRQHLLWNSRPSDMAAVAVNTFLPSFTQQRSTPQLKEMYGALVDYGKELKAFGEKDIPGLKEKADKLQIQVGATAMAFAAALFPNAALAAVATTVDKSGFIGGIANVIEMGIDFGHDALQQLGVENSYGLSICLFTLLLKFATYPLIAGQMSDSETMKQLQPLTEQIKELPAKNPEQEMEKNVYLGNLYDAAKVNPLASLFPSLAQIPVFIGLYRALQNLNVEQKLSEPFLWIPNLEGPTFNAPPGETMRWFTSIFHLNPTLGWETTADFLSIPLILFVAQKTGQKVLQPPTDPNKPVTRQEIRMKLILENFPFLTAFFSLNVPAGLSIYWITNSILTTLIAKFARLTFANQTLPPEVEEVMKMVDARKAQLEAADIPGTRVVLPTSSDIPGIKTTIRVPVAETTNESSSHAKESGNVEVGAASSSQIKGELKKRFQAVVDGFQQDVRESFDKMKNPTHDAAKKGDVAALQRISKNPLYSIDAKDSKGFTPLAYAVGANRRDAVKYLLDGNADPKSVDNNGNNALHFAAGYGHKELVEQLLNVCNSSWTNTENQTPIDVAKGNKQEVIVKLLVPR